VPPTDGDARPVLLDTSAAIALLLQDHEAHGRTSTALAQHELGLAGHAAFETFSVLTRLPPPARLTAAAASRLLTANFAHTRFLSPSRAGSLLDQLPAHGIAGGAVYDALVGAAALEHGLALASRDVRALETYRVLGVDVQLLD
jgi:predicted nucleic acid-binding protein